MDKSNLIFNLLKDAPYPVSVKEAKGRYVFVNAHFCKLFMFDESEDILGKVDADFGWGNTLGKREVSIDAGEL